MNNFEHNDATWDIRDINGPESHGLGLDMSWYHHNISNLFVESNKIHNFNKQKFGYIVASSDYDPIHFDFSKTYPNDLEKFAHFLKGNIERIDVTGLIKNKKYRDPAFQPWCVDSRQSENIIQVPGGMLLLYESGIAGIKRWLGESKKSNIDQRDRDIYRQFIHDQSEQFLSDKPYLWCHCSDKYCEHNQESNYKDVDHIGCWALNFFVDENQKNYYKILSDLKSNPEDVQYMKHLIWDSYNKWGIKTLEWEYNAEGFLYVEPRLYKYDNNIYAKSIKNNKNRWQEFFVYDSILSELVAEDIINDLSNQIYNNANDQQLSIIDEIIRYNYSNKDNKLIRDISDSKDMDQSHKFALLNRYKTLKTLRARISYIASHLDPVVKVAQKNKDTQTLFHIEL